MKFRAKYFSAFFSPSQHQVLHQSVFTDATLREHFRDGIAMLEQATARGTVDFKFERHKKWFFADVYKI